MKHTRVTAFLLVLALTAGLLVLPSCGKQEEPKEVEHPISITLTVKFPKEAKRKGTFEITQAKFNVENDSNVNEALQLYCNVEDISVSVDTTNGTVDAIDHIANGDLGENAAWHFMLNGKKMDKKSSETTLRDGDSVVWYYSIPRAEKKNADDAESTEE